MSMYFLPDLLQGSRRTPHFDWVVNVIVSSRKDQAKTTGIPWINTCKYLYARLSLVYLPDPQSWGRLTFQQQTRVPVDDFEVGVVNFVSTFYNLGS